jgi:hypothetical protein
MNQSLPMPRTATAAALRTRISNVSTVAGVRVFAWALILMGVARLFGSIDHAAYRNDFAHYYLSARMMLAGENPYTTPLKPLFQELGMEYDRRIPTGSNPPLLNYVVATVAWMPLPAAFGAWLALQAAALWGLLVATRRLLSMERGDVLWLLLIGVVLNTVCVRVNFYYSQVQIMVAACLAAAVLLHLQNRRPASCAVAVFAAALKIYPAALLPWFLLADLQGWRDFRRRSLAMAGVGAAVLALTGVEAWQGFVTDGLAVVKLSVGGSLTNYSLPALIMFIVEMHWGRPLPTEMAPYAHWIGQGAAALAIGAAYFVVWRRRLEPVAALGVLTAAMLAASLVCWTHYMVLMILPVAWLWYDAMSKPPSETRWFLLVAGTLCLWPQLDMIPIVGGMPRLLLHYYPLAAMGIVAWLLVKSKTRMSSASTALVT